jgi:hypothetical protein
VAYIRIGESTTLEATLRKVLIATVLLAAVCAAAQTVPAGTALKVRLQTTLSTFSSKSGDPFTGQITEAVTINGQTMIPVGTTLEGRVSKVSQPHRIKGRPTIGILPQAVVLASGEKMPVSATLVDTNLRHGSDVNEEGQFKGPSHDRKDLLTLGGGTGGGMLVGALVAGGKGTLVGAAIGAGATIGYWLYKRNAAVLPMGTELVIELDRPLTLATVSGQ